MVQCGCGDYAYLLHGQTALHGKYDMEGAMQDGIDAVLEDALRETCKS